MAKKVKSTKSRSNGLQARWKKIWYGINFFFFFQLCKSYEIKFPCKNIFFYSYVYADMQEKKKIKAL